MKDTEKLLDLAEAGDSQAIADLLNRHRGRLKRMVATRLDARAAQRVDPSDVVQDSLADAANRLTGYLRHRPIPFYAWLRQLAWDRLIQVHRKHLHAQKRSVHREQAWSQTPHDGSRAHLIQCLAGDLTSPSGVAQKREDERRLQVAIDCLTAEEQELLVLRYVEQLSPQEAAAVMRIKPNTFSQRHIRALKKLRQLMDVSEG